MIDPSVVSRLVEAYDPAAQTEEIANAKQQLAEVLERFPKSGWPTMTLDRYALGQADYPENFCRWMEFVTANLGSIRGGSARKHLIYFQAGPGEWWFNPKLYSSVEEAWQAVRQGFVDAIGCGDRGKWSEIDAIAPLRSGPALVNKTMYIYFPDQILPINSQTHLRHFLRELGEPRADDSSLGTVLLNRLLLEGLRSCPELDGWSMKEMERLLYEYDLNPFGKPVSTSPISDVADFIRSTLEDSDERLVARREAEDQARALLEAKAGTMTESDARDLLRFFNVDFHQGKKQAGRFSPGFGGAHANGLVSHLNAFNEFTSRIWRGSDGEAVSTVEQLVADKKLLPSAGISYPSMLMYLRAPEQYAIWLAATDAGLRRLSAYDLSTKPGTGGPDVYHAFSAAAVQLMQDFDIPPELLDFVLAAAAQYKPSNGVPTPSKGVKAWIFQANPKVYAIDQALADMDTVDWTVRQYPKEVHAGDRVYLWRAGPEAGVVAVTTVMTDPKVSPGDPADQYVLDQQALTKAELRVDLHVDKVLPLVLPRHELLTHPVLKGLSVLQFSNATNFRVDPDEDRALLALIEGEGVSEVAFAPVTDALAKRVYLPRSWLQAEILDLLCEKGQLVFYGPPGTGKTLIAQRIAEHLTADRGRHELVQFHPSYSYEDFFEGFRPVQLDGGIGISYELTPGPLRRMASLAESDPTQPYVLIVDEINRGNIPKIFGELLFLLEYRDRRIALQYSPEPPFRLPKNLFLIATMNTADRSIALVDAALRRRFYFVPFMPREEPIHSVLRLWLEENELDVEPVLLMDALNARIGDDEISIGPSYFMTSNGSAPKLDRVWKHALMPLLEEHYYGTGRDVAAEFGLSALRASLAQQATAHGEEPLEAASPSPES